MGTFEEMQVLDRENALNYSLRKNFSNSKDVLSRVTWPLLKVLGSIIAGLNRIE